jgi:hypothetical protein
MVLFYNYKKNAVKRSFKKAKRYMQYLESYGKWYFIVKFCQKNTLAVPSVNSWDWRSFYLQRTELRDRELGTRVMLLHLFWVFDVWQVKQPSNLSFITEYPPVVYNHISHQNPLELYSTLHRWKYKFALKKSRLYPYILSKVWKEYLSEQWTTRSYIHYMTWRKKTAFYNQCITNSQFYKCLNFWFLGHRYFHTIENRLYCKTYSNPQYSRALWLRLVQYPSIYDKRWFSFLVYLSSYKLRADLPWDLIYKSRDMWTFDPTARLLQRLLNFLVKKRITITEYRLIMVWKNLLTRKDPLSRLVQIRLRTSSIVRRRTLRAISN